MVIETVKKMNIKVCTPKESREYEIFIKNGLIFRVSKILKKYIHDSNLIILTNNKVKRLWLKHLTESLDKYGQKYHIISIPDGEKYKEFDTYRRITNRLTSLHIDRHATFLTFGGGVVGDLGGFVAATYKRGIRLVHVPTTLIAQIDSSIGGKVAIDLKEGKNLVGAFYHPALVITDPQLLTTLNNKEFINGLFEAVKIALVSNPALFEYMLRNFPGIIKRQRTVINKLVYQCALEKVKIVEKDPYDNDLRMILNFGHTFGHALETAGEYKKLSHGEAVGWGMLLAFRLSEIAGFSHPGEFDNPRHLIGQLLSSRSLPKIKAEILWNVMSHDKKAIHNRMRFVLLKKIGRPLIKSVTKKQFIKALELL